MLGRWRERATLQRTAEDIYGVVVASARSPVFFSAHGVPDTPEGRYEMIVLHLALVLERLRAEGSAVEPVSRALIEAFVTDMDEAMREMGVGDLTVPKKVKGAAAGLYARAGALRDALAETAPDARSRLVAEVTARFALSGTVTADAAAARALAARVEAVTAHLGALPSGDVCAGRIALPAPD